MYHQLYCTLAMGFFMVSIKRALKQNVPSVQGYKKSSPASRLTSCS